VSSLTTQHSEQTFPKIGNCTVNTADW